jgi:microcystin-dependent protein
MPVATNISELNTTAGLNYPSGSESPATLDDYLRSHASFIAQLRDADTGVQSVALGGTGATTAAGARTSLSLYSTAEILGLIEQPGSTKAWPAATPPAGWLVMDGSAVSRTTYAALFAVIGTLWGVGDGSTTFNLPPAAGRVILGAGGSYSVGAVGGSADSIVVAHSHTVAITDPTHAHFVQGTGGGGASSGVQGNSSGGPSGGVVTSNAATGITASATSTGSSGVGANMPPYAVFLPIIKY